MEMHRTSEYFLLYFYTCYLLIAIFMKLLSCNKGFELTHFMCDLLLIKRMQLRTLLSALSDEMSVWLSKCELLF